MCKWKTTRREKLGHIETSEIKLKRLGVSWKIRYSNGTDDSFEVQLPHPHWYTFSVKLGLCRTECYVRLRIHTWPDRDRVEIWIKQWKMVRKPHGYVPWLACRRLVVAVYTISAVLWMSGTRRVKPSGSGSELSVFITPLLLSFLDLGNQHSRIQS